MEALLLIGGRVGVLKAGGGDGILKVSCVLLEDGGGMRNGFRMYELIEISSASTISVRS